MTTYCLFGTFYKELWGCSVLIALHVLYFGLAEAAMTWWHLIKLSFRTVIRLTLVLPNLENLKLEF